MYLCRLALWKKVGLIALTLVVLLFGVLGILTDRPVPERIQYGMSFNTPYARELGLDWQDTYDAILDELGVRHLRLAAHWPMVEPRKDTYNFAELDYQIERAEEVGATVVFAVGRRLPRWPECHVPPWASELSWTEQQEQILEYMTLVVERYKNSPAITYWQVENEPYLTVFAYEHCGDFDEVFFEQQVDHVRSLDTTRPILVTDSGNLGVWAGPWRNGDAFGTSVYVHFWNPELGQFRTVLPAWFYRVKTNVMELIYGEQESILIELSAEPWLLEPVTNVDLDTQYSRMDLEKFNDIIEYARDTRFEKQYLWGAEWWYWLLEQGESHMWERGKELFSNSV